MGGQKELLPAGVEVPLTRLFAVRACIRQLGVHLVELEIDFLRSQPVEARYLGLRVLREHVRGVIAGLLFLDDGIFAVGFRGPLRVDFLRLAAQRGETHILPSL